MLKVIVVAFGLSMLIACGDSTQQLLVLKWLLVKIPVGPVVDSVYESLYDGTSVEKVMLCLVSLAEHKCKIIDWLDKNHNYALHYSKVY